MPAGTPVPLNSVSTKDANAGAITGSDGRVYYASGTRLQSVALGGHIEWVFEPTPSGTDLTYLDLGTPALGCDGTLYVSGFFPEHLDAKGLDPAYLARIGATAYGAASTLLAQGRDGTDLFGELAQGFERFVRVLRDVADGLFAHRAQSAQRVVEIYERWLKTGSDSLGRALAAQGLMPVRGSSRVGLS